MLKKAEASQARSVGTLSIPHLYLYSNNTGRASGASTSCELLVRFINNTPLCGFKNQLRVLESYIL